MASNPSVSIVIPVFERASLALEAVRSAAAQIGVRAEVIVVDDGSTSDMSELRNAVARMGGRTLRTDHRGPAHARNVGIAAACGELVAFLDSDDLFYDSKLITQAGSLQHSGAAWSCCGYDTVAADGTTVETTLLDEVDETSFWNYSCPFGATAVVARRDALIAIGGFDESFDVCEDWDLLIRLGARFRPSVVRRSLYAYRTGCGNITSTQAERWFAGWNRLEEKHGVRFSIAAYPFLANLMPQINDLALLGWRSSTA
jgi:glycosyltransferase involved in cell wall biosynthesis